MEKTDCNRKLLEVATQLFSERGLHGVSIRELSQAAGTSISMISYHFGSKEGLYSAVLQQQFACFAEIHEIRQRVSDPVEMVESYLRWTFQRHRNNPYLLRFYTSELTNPTAFFATLVMPVIDEVIVIMAQAIAEGIRQKRFRADVDPTNAALALAGMVNYFFLSSQATENLISHSPEQDEKLVQQYLAIFTRGVGAP
ncbi:TetR/AcrR family transcriptional regulator [Geomonas sp. Red69]|uniref:TetR/AcrR family transcriptional regulator n=1 Tax=Geomonas diazotrophica TaxID=2843197 RepID=A0ABX8JJ47_9BACT|nr:MULTISPECIES: TetR/AcrR family transcriptional regulator [Geomonas]MBU5638540.1 TetR/AcrR family transcriptional regulator [Geomonas diazotrophica]QWV97186.1 TetR/AcrR family transcriptional regulator [Geomonas nitrogeniifigens]QXE86358.1 TetR/AcrR family transcriptional regulator [Geomonas nitrogeniifigens]